MLKYSAAALILSAALWIHAQAQEKPGPAPVSLAVFDIRTCFDRENVARIKEIDQELQALADELARKIQKTPEDREKLRGEYLALYDRRKLEIYTALDQVVAAIGKERGYTAILKLDPLPQIPATKNDATLSQQFDRRGVMYGSAQVDITAEVLKRLNEALARQPRKNY